MKVLFKKQPNWFSDVSPSSPFLIAVETWQGLICSGSWKFVVLYFQVPTYNELGNSWLQHMQISVLFWSPFKEKFSYISLEADHVCATQSNL